MSNSSTSDKQIFDAVEQVATYLDEQGNQGSSARHIPFNAWVLKPNYKPYRDGVLFYSSGWGWRVRKKPHWREVLQHKRDATPRKTSLNDVPE